MLVCRIMFYHITDSGIWVKRLLPATEPTLAIDEWVEEVRDSLINEAGVHMVGLFDSNYGPFGEYREDTAGSDVVINVDVDQYDLGGGIYDFHTIHQAVQAVAATRNAQGSLK